MGRHLYKNFLVALSTLSFSVAQAQSENQSFLFNHGKATFDDFSNTYNFVPHTDEAFHPYINWNTFDDYKDGYITLWKNVTVRENKKNIVDDHIDIIMRGEQRYRKVSPEAGIPWWAIGIIHMMEAGANFAKHQHNGDSLSARTVKVPAGRPTTGRPPFTWEESCIDATKYEKLDTIKVWKPEYLAFALETFNGFGYRSKGINSPYLWAYTQHWTKGKYVADSVYDPNADTSQAGGMTILKRMMDKGILKLDLQGQVVDASQKIIDNTQNLYCKEGFAPEKRGEGWECTSATEMNTLFTPEVVKLCLEKTENDPSCLTSQWEKEFAWWLRGEKRCAEGLQYHEEGDYCYNEQDVYGPFTKKHVELCLKYEGGEDVCLTNRWGKEFFTGINDELSK